MSVCYVCRSGITALACTSRTCSAQAEEVWVTCLYCRLFVMKQYFTEHTLQVLVDPEAAARTKIHKQERKAAGRKRKLEDVQRRRGAGLAVKNKKKFRNEV